MATRICFDIIRHSLYAGTLLLYILTNLCKGDLIEKKLIDDIFSNYSILERPVVNHEQPLVVKIKFSLQQIVDVDLRNQIITTNAWLDLQWNDYRWKWNREKYNNLSKTRIPYSKIWTPDILLYNSADKNFDSTTHTPVVIDYNGDCLHIPPGIFKSTCKIDVSNFPFDEQNCTLKFGVWSYDASQVDLALQEKGGGVDTTEYTQSGEWLLVGVVGERNAHKYNCCSDSFVDVTFTVILQRRTMFYIINLILPCILNSVLTLLTFFLPAEAAEKITLSITVLLAQIVFMLLIMETMPPTSDAIPIISKYFACSLITVCSSVAGTVLVLSFYYTSPEIDGHLPPRLKTFLLETAPKWMRLKPYCSKSCKTANANYVEKEKKKYEIKNKRSSLQANNFAASNLEEKRLVEVTLDTIATMQPKTSIYNNKMESPFVDFHPIRTTDLNSESFSDNAPSSATTSTDIYDDIGDQTEKRRNNSSPSIGTFKLLSTSHKDATIHRKNCFQNKSKKNRVDDLQAMTSCMQSVLEGLQCVNEKIEKDNINNEILLEWQFAARVLDKILLWFFSLFVIIATLATLFAVPNINEAFSV